MNGSIEKKKQDVAAMLQEISQDFRRFINNEFQDLYSYFSDEIEENVLNLLKVDKPKVMVYGIYNSGKSTLINSLCKDEIAETADRPMTAQIAEYDRGDYYLVDSPGVDAPIEHEMVTEEHLNKCHIILFVISSKGIFEDRTNYEKLAQLIKKDVPFVIVLNDRGCPVEKDWDDAKKKSAKFAHEQELKIIQYKIIENLISVSKDAQIANKYEVVVLNAKKAWIGIEKNKPQLYASSGVDFLDKRITQLIHNDASLNAIFKQPISNIKECFNKVEKVITQTMSGNTSEDFCMRIHIFERKKDNIMEELRVLTLQAVQSHLDELTNSYVNGDGDVFETIANTIFMDIDDRYTAKLNELMVYVDHNFKNLNLCIDGISNLIYDSQGKVGSVLSFLQKEEIKKTDNYDLESEKEKKGFFDFLKSRNQREKEKLERLEREASLRNEKMQYEVQENIRKRQEARQLASSDLDTLYREFIKIVNAGLDEKYDEVISQIQQIECINKQLKEAGERQMTELRQMRKGLSAIENAIS